MYENVPFIWNLYQYDFKGIEKLRNFDFENLRLEDKSIRSACFSNFNVEDKEQFQAYYQKIQKYFLNGKQVFDPLQTHLNELIIITPHCLSNRNAFGNRSYLVPMVAAEGKSSVIFRLKEM